MAQFHSKQNMNTIGSNNKTMQAYLNHIVPWYQVCVGSSVTDVNETSLSTDGVCLHIKHVMVDNGLSVIQFSFMKMNESGFNNRSSSILLESLQLV